MSSNKLKIFPYQLARVSGLPFSILNDFRLGENEDFEKQLKEFQIKLQELSHSQVLLKGALQTSDSFFENIIRYQKKPISTFRKKEFQTQRSLFQYLARTVAKTSPFSTLTTLTPMQLEGNIFKNIPLKVVANHVQFNHQLFVEIKHWILENSEVIQFLNVKINASLKWVNEDLIFYIHQNQEEKVQRIENDESIALILNQLKSPIPFRQLLNNLSELIEAEELELKNYLMQLFAIGLLEFEIPVFIHTENREGQWLEWIKTLPEFRDQKEIITLFLFLKNSKSKLQSAEAKERLLLKKEITKKLRDFGIDDVLSKYLFYENVGTEFSISLDKEEVEPILNLTSELAKLAMPFCLDLMSSKMISFFEKKKKKKIRINLLEFFEQFFQQDIDEIENDKNQLNDYYHFWKKEINDLIQLDETGNINFYISDLMKIDEKMRERFSLKPFDENKEQLLSGHFQFFYEKEKLKAVVNGIAPGNGKLFGRFSYFFPKEFNQALRNWNQTDEKESWIQNNDSTVFNANSHEDFFSEKIENRWFKHLEIEWNDGAFSLWNAERNQSVKIFDTGIVAPNQRSKMFQLLKVFGVPHISFSFLRKIVNELLNEKEFYQNLPIITIDNQLVIQRKGQIFSTNYLPNPSQLDSEKEFYDKLLAWRKMYLNSDFQFIKILHEPSVKPQLIDFKSPLSLLVFRKILNQKPKAILLEEMLPSEENIKEEKFCKEIVIQWKKEK